MPVDIYKSTDTGAPVLTGEYGKLVDLLDAVLVNGYGVYATGTLTGTGTAPSDGDTVTINGRVYTFKTTLTGAADEVLIGASSTTALTNLQKAINLTGVAGTDYGTGTTINANVSAGSVSGTPSFVLTAKISGTVGNAITTTESSTQLSFGSGTLTGGSNTKAAAGWTKPYSSSDGLPSIYTHNQATNTSSTSHIANNIVVSPGTTIIWSILTVDADGNGSQTLTTPSGWTILVDHERFGVDGGDACLCVYYKHIKSSADATVPNHTVTANETCYFSSTWMSFTNVDLNDPFVVSDTGTPVAAGLTADSPAITLDGDNDIIFCLIALHDSVGVTQPSGFTSASSISYSTADTSMYQAYRIGNAAGAQGPFTWTKTSNNGTTSYTLTFGIKGAYGSAKQAAFRQGGGNMRYLVLNDGAGLGFLSQEVKIQMAESMSTVYAGANITPSTNLAWRKSWTTDTTARSWAIVADDKRFFIMINTGDLAGAWYVGFFGDFESYIGSDVYNTLLLGRTVGSGSASNESIGFMTPLGNSNTVNTFVLRNYVGAGSGFAIRKFTDSINFIQIPAGQQSVVGPAASLPFPNPQNGALYASDVYLHEDHTVQTAANVIRGRIPGLWFPLHPTTLFDDQTVYVGEGEHVGKQFIYFKSVFAGTSYGNTAGMLIEFSDTWE